MLLSKQTYKQIKQKEDLKNEHMHIQSTDLQQEFQKYATKIEQSLQLMMLENYIHMKKNEIKSFILYNAQKYTQNRSQTSM